MRDNRMKGIAMEAAIFFDSHLPNALRQALEYAGDDGFVASMPQLLRARVNASYDNIIWNTWFTANSEESVVTTPQGNRVVVAVHGGGIFDSTSSLRAELPCQICSIPAPRASRGRYAARISQRGSIGDVLEGKLPDGTEFPGLPIRRVQARRH